ncbi:MAG TPA: response regulator [Ktedonobacterales bacterium]|nr:response regulator [Ktedonobacterales bacterium]
MRVLVVDDDKGIRETLGALLEEEGYDVSVAADGEEGLRVMLATREPMVVLLDLLLPTLSGEDALAAALEYFEGVGRSPVSFIIITANPQSVTAHLRTLIQRHHIPVEYKPFDTDHLLAEVERASAGGLVAG